MTTSAGGLPALPHRGPRPRPPAAPPRTLARPAPAPAPVRAADLGLAPVFHVAARLRHLVAAVRVVRADPLGRRRLPLARIDQLAGLGAHAAHRSGLDALQTTQEGGRL